MDDYIRKLIAPGFEGSNAEHSRILSRLIGATFGDDMSVDLIAQNIAETVAAGKPTTFAVQNYIASKVREPFQARYDQYRPQAYLPAGPLEYKDFFSVDRNAYQEVLDQPIDLSPAKLFRSKHDGPALGSLMPGAFEADTVYGGMRWLALTQTPSSWQHVSKSFYSDRGELLFRTANENQILDEYQSGWLNAFSGIHLYDQKRGGSFAPLWNDMFGKGVRGFRRAEIEAHTGMISEGFFNNEGPTDFGGYEGEEQTGKFLDPSISVWESMATSGIGGRAVSGGVDSSGRSRDANWIERLSVDYDTVYSGMGLPSMMWTTEEAFSSGMYGTSNGNWKLSPLHGSPSAEYGVQVQLSGHSINTFGKLYETWRPLWNYYNNVYPLAEAGAKEFLYDEMQRNRARNHGTWVPPEGYNYGDLLTQQINKRLPTDVPRPGTKEYDFWRSGEVFQKELRDIQKSVYGAPAHEPEESNIGEFEQLVAETDATVDQSLYNRKWDPRQYAQAQGLLNNADKYLEWERHLRGVASAARKTDPTSPQYGPLPSWALPNEQQALWNAEDMTLINGSGGSHPSVAQAIADRRFHAAGLRAIIEDNYAMIGYPRTPNAGKFGEILPEWGVSRPEMGPSQNVFYEHGNNIIRDPRLGSSILGPQPYSGLLPIPPRLTQRQQMTDETWLPLPGPIYQPNTTMIVARPKGNFQGPSKEPLPPLDPMGGSGKSKGDLTAAGMEYFNLSDLRNSWKFQTEEMEGPRVEDTYENSFLGGSPEDLDDIINGYGNYVGPLRRMTEELTREIIPVGNDQYTYGPQPNTSIDDVNALNESPDLIVRARALLDARSGVGDAETTLQNALLMFPDARGRAASDRQQLALLAAQQGVYNIDFHQFYEGLKKTHPLGTKTYEALQGNSNETIAKELDINLRNMNKMGKKSHVMRTRLGETPEDARMMEAGRANPRASKYYRETLKQISDQYGLGLSLEPGDEADLYDQMSALAAEAKNDPKKAEVYQAVQAGFAERGQQALASRHWANDLHLVSGEDITQPKQTGRTPAPARGDSHVVRGQGGKKIGMAKFSDNQLDEMRHDQDMGPMGEDLINADFGVSSAGNLTPTPKRVSDMTRDEMIHELTHDQMTGLKNRRAFDEEANEGSWFMVTDIEGLKAVNDRYGHPAGDQVIRAGANAMKVGAGEKRAYKGADRGDEFYGVFGSQEQAEAGGKAATQAMDKQRISLEGEEYQGLGIAYGIGRTLEEADLDMNRRKDAAIHEGRRAKRGDTPINLRRAVTLIPLRVISGGSGAAETPPPARSGGGSGSAGGPPEEPPFDERYWENFFTGGAGGSNGNGGNGNGGGGNVAEATPDPGENGNGRSQNAIPRDPAPSSLRDRSTTAPPARTQLANQSAAFSRFNLALNDANAVFSGRLYATENGQRYGVNKYDTEGFRRGIANEFFDKVAYSWNQIAENPVASVEDAVDILQANLGVDEELVRPAAEMIFQEQQRLDGLGHQKLQKEGALRAGTPRRARDAGTLKPEQMMAATGRGIPGWRSLAQDRVSGIDLNAALSDFSSPSLGEATYTAFEDAHGVTRTTRNIARPTDDGFIETVSPENVAKASNMAQKAYTDATSGALPGGDSDAIYATVKERMYSSLQKQMLEEIKSGESNGMSKTDATAAAQVVREVADHLVKKVGEELKTSLAEGPGEVTGAASERHDARVANRADAQSLFDKSARVRQALGGRSLQEVMDSKDETIVLDENDRQFSFGGQNGARWEGSGVSGAGNSGAGRNLWKNMGKFGSAMYGMYMIGREWKMAMGETMQQAQAYSQLVSEFSPIALDGADAITSGSAGAIARQEIAAMESGEAANQVFGGFGNVNYMMSGMGTAPQRLMVSGRTALGMGMGTSMGMATLGMMGIGGEAMTQLATPVGVGVGLGLLGVTGVMEAYNAIAKPPDGAEATFGNAIQGAFGVMSLYSAASKYQHEQGWGILSNARALFDMRVGGPGDEFMQKLKPYMSEQEWDVANDQGTPEAVKKMFDKAQHVMRVTGEDQKSVLQGFGVMTAAFGQLEDQDYNLAERVSQYAIEQGTTLQKVASEGMQYAQGLGAEQGTAEYERLTRGYMFESNKTERDRMGYTGGRWGALSGQWQSAMGTGGEFNLLASRLSQKYSFDTQAEQSAVVKAANAIQIGGYSMSAAEQDRLGGMVAQAGTYQSGVISEVVGGMIQFGAMTPMQGMNLMGELSSAGMSGQQADTFGRMLQGDLGAYSFQAWQSGNMDNAFLDRAGRSIFQTSGSTAMQVWNHWAPKVGMQGGMTTQQFLGTSNAGINSAFAEGGFYGLQKYANEQSYNASMASIGVQMKGIALQENYLWGSNAGGSWSNPTEGSYWGIEDRMTAMQRSSQQANFADQWARMTTSNSFSIQREDNQATRMQINNGYQNWQFSQQYNQFQQSQQWAQADWDYQDTMRGLNFGWQMEDMNEGIRFSSGRQRRQLVRQRDRAALSHNLEEDNVENQRDHQKQLWAQQEEAYQKQKSYMTEMQRLDQESFTINKNQRETFYKMDVEAYNRRMKEYEEETKLQDELKNLQRKYQFDQIQLQKEAAGAQAAAAAAQKEINDAIAEGQKKWGELTGTIEQMNNYNMAFRLINATEEMFRMADNIQMVKVQKIIDFLKTLGATSNPLSRNERE